METFTGTLPTLPAAATGRDPARRLDSAGWVELGVDDPRFSVDLLDDLQARLCVDPARVAAAWLAEWANRDGCPGDAGVFLDTAEVTGVRWSGCRDGAEVVHYRINGGNHQAPGTVDGRPFAGVLWDFFADHRLPARFR